MVKNSVVLGVSSINSRVITKLSSLLLMFCTVVVITWCFHINRAYALTISCGGDIQPPLTNGEINLTELGYDGSAPDYLASCDVRDYTSKDPSDLLLHNDTEDQVLVQITPKLYKDSQIPSIDIPLDPQGESYIHTPKESGRYDIIISHYNEQF